MALDVSRGSLLADNVNPARVCKSLGASLAWLNERPLAARGRYLLKAGTQTSRVIVRSIESVVDIGTGALQPTKGLEINDIGQVVIDSAQPLALDAYSEVCQTGCFILIDETTNDTVAAGRVTATA